MYGLTNCPLSLKSLKFRNIHKGRSQDILDILHTSDLLENRRHRTLELHQADGITADDDPIFQLDFILANLGDIWQQSWRAANVDPYMVVGDLCLSNDGAISIT